MESPQGAAVRAEGFGLKGPRGWVFRGVAIDAEPGSLIAIAGPSGSGRTCLLLALTGRMKPSEGHADIGRHRLPKKMAAVRRISALAHVPGVNDLDPALTVAEQLREGVLLQRRYEGPVRALLRPRGERRLSASARIEEALAAAGLDPDTLPKGPRTAVRDLERLESLRLSVAIALLAAPRLLALDDVDLKLPAAERAEAWALLRSLAERGTTVVAACSEAPEEATVLRLGVADEAREQPEPPATRALRPDRDSKITWGAEPTETAADSAAAAKGKGDGEAGTEADEATPAAATPDATEPDATEPEAAADGATRSETAAEATDHHADEDTADAATADADTKGTDDALTQARRA
ncbi:ATP-binding cassette domain-containing protein [Streptomyces sp. NPDC091259]|uniref:ATP-binding cassette domain-containing protein n=1 Tax=Streptomyces sp. NPDC091259 TaxID=3365976 RepID=UPI00381FAA25